MKGIREWLFDTKEVEKDVLDPSPRKTREKQHALNLSMKEGAAANFSLGLSSQYVTPFALALKANSLHIGLLSSLAELASPIFQLYGSKMMAHRSRKRIVLEFVFLQALTWIAITLLALAFWRGIFQDYLIYVLIVVYTLFAIFSGVATPPWFSWMGDIVPEQDRGKYFSIRNRTGGAVSLIAVLIGAFVLDIFETKGLALIGFAILFALTSLFRFISFMYFRKQYAPRFRVKKGSYFTLWSFIKRSDNYGKFVFYNMAFYFALMIASPFFAVYMLDELNFSYITFTVVTMSSSVFYLLFSPLLGRISDKYGNVKLLYVGTFLFALNPLLWIFIKNPIGLIFVPQLVTGLANAAYVISSTNFVYDAVSPQKRAICLSYKNLLMGIGAFAGALIGGVLLKYGFFGYTKIFVLVFAVSAVLRFLSGAIFLPMVKDERKTERMPVFRLNLAHPFKTIHHDIGWFRAISKK